MEAVRTPDDRFTALPDWPFARQYVSDSGGYDGVRVQKHNAVPDWISRVFARYRNLRGSA